MHRTCPAFGCPASISLAVWTHIKILQFTGQQNMGPHTSENGLQYRRENAVRKNEREHKHNATNDCHLFIIQRRIIHG